MRVAWKTNRFFVLIVSCLFLPQAVFAHGDVTFVSWTGSYMRAQILGFVNPYEQQTGKNVMVEHYAGGIEEIRNQVESSNVVWDVVDMIESDMLRACNEGLLESLAEIDLPPGVDGTPASEDFVEGAVSECGVGGIRWSTSYAYDKRLFGDDPPETISDFFDVEKYPGPRAVRRDPSVLLEWALMAEGVAPDNVYATLETEEGVDKAFAVLDRIRPGILWWSNELDPIRHIEESSAAITSIWTVSGTTNSSSPDSNVSIVVDGAITEMDLYAIPKGTPRLSEALAFLRYASSSKALAQQAMHQPIEPTRRSSYQLIPDAIKAQFVTGPNAGSQSVLASDAGWWAENYDRLYERFNAWATQTARQGASGGVR